MKKSLLSIVIKAVLILLCGAEQPLRRRRMAQRVLPEDNIFRPPAEIAVAIFPGELDRGTQVGYATSPSDTSSGLPAAAIAGITMSVAVVAILFIFSMLLIHRRQRKRQQDQSEQAAVPAPIDPHVRQTFKNLTAQRDWIGVESAAFQEILKNNTNKSFFKRGRRCSPNKLSKIPEIQTGTKEIGLKHYLIASNPHHSALRTSDTDTTESSLLECTPLANRSKEKRRHCRPVNNELDTVNRGSYWDGPSPKLSSGVPVDPVRQRLRELANAKDYDALLLALDDIKKNCTDARKQTPSLPRRKKYSTVNTSLKQKATRKGLLGYNDCLDDAISSQKLSGIPEASIDEEHTSDLPYPVKCNTNERSFNPRVLSQQSGNLKGPAAYESFNGEGSNEDREIFDYDRNTLNKDSCKDLDDLMKERNWKGFITALDTLNFPVYPLD